MANGEMSVAQMRKMIESGNVVSYRGRILRNVADLPTEQDNAVTLEEKQAALKQLQAEHADRQADIDRLTSEIEELQTAPGDSKPGKGAKGARAAANRQPPTEQQFAGKPLGYFEKLTKGSKDEAEARSRILSEKGMDDPTADQIIAALNDEE
jgi:hypothetical protein